jgi:aminoglycoside/choline kinase family phosphotransferase
LNNSNSPQTLKALPKKIAETFEKLSGSKHHSIVQLPQTASDRLYFRITDVSGNSFIATHSNNLIENQSFIKLTQHFHSHGLNVPQIFFQNEDCSTYIQQDLGDVSLFSLLQSTNQPIDNQIKSLYKAALQQLVEFQFVASKDLDFRNCYPVESFDKVSIHWDLNYFKYYFLKLSPIHFEEHLLEREFQTIIDFFSQQNFSQFMYRDFQSRNIMIVNKEPFFIDYQGGRKGPYTYDLASCILDAKADLPFDFRDEIVKYYYTLIHRHTNISRDAFQNLLQWSMLIRIMQAMGAYGFRGFIQKKSLFLQSIPYAAKNLQHLIHHSDFANSLPYLFSILETICKTYSFAESENDIDKLTVHLYSFSYKKGIPEDSSSNGGGFIFDCRSLPNPGRNPHFQTKTGFDNDVIEQLEKEPAVIHFIENTSSVVVQAVENYLQRGFTNLLVAYGCTGGQHRSVFCANELSKLLHTTFANSSMRVKLIHRELGEQ